MSTISEQRSGYGPSVVLHDLDIASTRSGWLLTALCLTYAVLVFCLWPDRYVELARSYAAPFIFFLPMLLAGGLGVAALMFAWRNPANFMLGTLRARWIGAAPIILLFYLCITAFTTVRIAIPDMVPFHADRFLADFDVRLLGADSWIWEHRFVSGPVSALIFWSYEYCWVLQWFGTVLFVAFWNNAAGRLRYLWALALTSILCGAVLATLLSSVGPIFYDQLYGGNRFAGLHAALAATGYGGSVETYAAYLMGIHASGRPELGGGITAMPSMHVAFVTLNAFFLTGFGRRWAIGGWSFAALILFGSVYTGWHYAADGYVSILVVSLIWYLTGRFVSPNASQLSRAASEAASDIGLPIPDPART
ncbi:phosphatase PAP2 family protein [Mesorhizobium sp. INR15]|uniref:phosphatase PAP2 family protein n=1 Tax=Mesorhizobium sp. INR15 TaxID=2654248 RepID=UPI0018968EDA|nr:phosphatase PAP2 family protein [Mesorhizobium sp. INR15]QPC92027.1 hypothetical protein GA829_16350 [Mesorhizobium sp. INR15]